MGELLLTTEICATREGLAVSAKTAVIFINPARKTDATTTMVVYLKWNDATSEEECLTVGTNRKRGWDENWFDFCCASSKKCDLSRCIKGQYLSGCMRALAGTCVSCPVAQVMGNTFWGAPLMP